MQAAESRRGRTSSADTRTPSGEVPSIEVGIGESNGQFITMRGIPTYSYALNHRGAALPRESGRPTGGARVPDFWAGPRRGSGRSWTPGSGHGRLRAKTPLRKASRKQIISCEIVAFLSASDNTCSHRSYYWSLRF